VLQKKYKAMRNFRLDSSWAINKQTLVGFLFVVVILIGINVFQLGLLDGAIFGAVVGGVWYAVEKLVRRMSQKDSTSGAVK